MTPSRHASILRVTVIAVMAAAIAIAVASVHPGAVLAGDTTFTSGATATMLPQAQSEGAWLQDFHVTGFLNQTFGMWQNPSALRDYTNSRNNLAVSRTWLQVDENYQPNEHNKFFMREWFVYEPPYSFNSANNGIYGKASCPPGGAGCASLGHFLNDFYNQYTIRDAWWENSWGPLHTYIGNQIVVWGQSIAFRVGDVVNPQDTSWAFGFANLEQSRIPQLMVHPILSLPHFGPFESNFIEGVLIPRYQPQWTWDYADGRYYNEMGVAGSVNQGFPSAMHGPSARFDSHYPSHFYPGRMALGRGLSPNGPFLEPGMRGLIPSPTANEFFYCTNHGSATQPFNPIPAKLQRFCPNLADGTVHFGPAGSGAVADIGQWKIPAATVANWEEGVRFHTLVGNTELTAFYLNTWNYYPNVFWQQYTNQFRFKYLPATFVALSGDRPLPIPGRFGESFPFVARAELVYANHQGYADFDALNHPSGVAYSDTLDMMYALDLDQAYAPWLTKTGNVTANIEVQDYVTLDANQEMKTGGSPWAGVGGGGGGESVNKNEVNALLNLGTSWWWGSFAPTWTMIFNPKGRTFLLFPSVILKPTWTDKYFLKLQAIQVLGGDTSSVGGGVLKGQSLLTAQFEYNFHLL